MPGGQGGYEVAGEGRGCHGTAVNFALGRRLAIVDTTEGGRDGEYT